MPSSNSNFISAGCTSVDTRMRGCRSWTIRCIKRLIVRLGEKFTVLVERHSFSFLSQEAPGAQLMKMPNLN